MNIFRKNPCPELPALPPAFPRFCRRCGSALVPAIEAEGFDERTGARKFIRWLRCPKWEGGQSKVVCYAPFVAVHAAYLNETFSSRLYPFGGWSDSDYIDCAPAANVPVAPDPAVGPC